MNPIRKLFNPPHRVLIDKDIKATELIEAAAWCQKTLKSGSWEFTMKFKKKVWWHSHSEKYLECVFKFDDAIDAIIFKLKFNV